MSNYIFEQLGRAAWSYGKRAARHKAAAAVHDRRVAAAGALIVGAFALAALSSRGGSSA